MRNRPVVYVSALAVIVAAIVALWPEPEPGANIRNPKSPLVKTHARICPEDAMVARHATGCEKGA